MKHIITVLNRAIPAVMNALYPFCCLWLFLPGISRAPSALSEALLCLEHCKNPCLCMGCVIYTWDLTTLNLFLTSVLYTYIWWFSSKQWWVVYVKYMNLNQLLRLMNRKRCTEDCVVIVKKSVKLKMQVFNCQCI